MSLLVKEAISVLVHHVEGMLKLLDLGLVKHHEDTGVAHCGCFSVALAVALLLDILASGGWGFPGVEKALAQYGEQGLEPDVEHTVW